MSPRILKFNSRALGSGSALRRACAIVPREAPEGALVLVSALQGGPEAIREALGAAARGDLSAARALLAALVERHRALARELGLPEPQAWKHLFERLETLLEGVGLVGELSARTRDAARVVADAAASELFADLLAREAPVLRRDLREVVPTDGRHGRARLDGPALREAASAWAGLLGQGRHLVSQASIGQGPDGAPTTLGRGGSDLIATTLGEALGADQVQIWTDVDGILSADPSLVPEARPIPALGLAEAAALSAFGAETLWAEALAPTARAGFRLVVGNTLHPETGRTAILAQAPPRARGEVTSVAYKEGVAALRFPPELGLEDLLDAALRLEEAGASRYGLLSSPEGSVLVLRPEGQSEALLADLVAKGAVLERGWAVVALVGEGLRQDPGAAARLLAPLAEERLGAVLGASPVSVAFLVPEERLPDLIPALHRCFILEGVDA